MSLIFALPLLLVSRAFILPVIWCAWLSELFAVCFPLFLFIICAVHLRCHAFYLPRHPPIFGNSFCYICISIYRGIYWKFLTSLLFINTCCGGVWSVYIALCSLLYQVGSCSGVIHFVCLRLECLLFEASLFGASDWSEWAVQAVSTANACVGVFRSRPLSKTWRRSQRRSRGWSWQERP